jgi:rubrerythrin
MKSTASLGSNLTGIATAPDEAEQMVAAAIAGTPVADPLTDVLGPVRGTYAEASEPVGSMPPPATLTGVAKAVAGALRGQKTHVFLDKLGERLAFERTGTRLYRAAVSKVEALGSRPGEPTPADLQEILEEEHQHMLLVAEAIRGLGADPTLQTPSADVAAVASAGLLQVVADPRTTVRDCLQALLQAELVDNDGWTVLAELAEGLSQHDLADRFREALLHEERHLQRVRHWTTAALEREAGGADEPDPDSTDEAPVKRDALGEQARRAGLYEPEAVPAEKATKRRTSKAPAPRVQRRTKTARSRRP